MQPYGIACNNEILLDEVQHASLAYDLCFALAIFPHFISHFLQLPLNCTPNQIIMHLPAAHHWTTPQPSGPLSSRMLQNETVDTTSSRTRVVYSFFVPKKSRHTYEEDLPDTYVFLMIFGLCELYSDWPQRLRPSLLVCAEAATSVLTTGLQIVHTLKQS